MSKRKASFEPEEETIKSNSKRARLPVDTAGSSSQSGEGEQQNDSQEGKDYGLPLFDDIPQLDGKEWDAFEKQFLPQIEAFRKKNEKWAGVELCQFMCHQYLTFDFGEQSNFGRVFAFSLGCHNGSGKSAVLAGLVVGLGGKASSTGRGTGVKSLIREGKSKAEVTVYIKNTGFGAYEPKLYGERIIVVRTIARNGPSSYKLKSALGAVVSTRKADLESICDYLDIQVDNPISILTQDSARRFLKASSPQYKYQLFMQGTFLQTLRERYNTVYENLESTLDILQAKSAGLKDLEARMVEANRAYEEGLRAQDLRSRQQRLLCEQAWSCVVEKQQGLQDAFEEMALQERKLGTIETKLVDAKTTFETMTKELRELEKNNKTSQRSAAALREEREEKKATLASKRQEMSGFKADENRINDAMKLLQDELSLLEKDILQESQTIEEDIQADNDRLHTETEKIKGKIVDLKAKAKAALDEQSRVNQDRSSAEAAKTEAEKYVQKVTLDLAELDKSKKVMESQKGDPLAPFGQNMLDIRKAVEKLNWHGKQPLGPLGMFVELENPAKWGDLMRRQIGRLMKSFAVTDPRDLPKLRKIITDAGNPRPTIIVTSNDPFDHSPGEPPEQYLTMLRTLRISHEAVKRILIDQAIIECTYLAETREHGEAILTERGNGVALTQNLFRVTLWKGDEGLKTETLYLIRNNDPLRRLFVNEGYETQVRSFDDQHQILQNILNQALASLQESTTKLAKFPERINSCRVTIVDLNHQIRQKEIALKELEEEGDDATPLSLAVLTQTKAEKALEKIMALQRDVDDLKRQAEVKEGDCEGFQSHISSCAVKHTAATQTKDHFERKKKGLETHLVALGEQKDEIVKTVESYREKASQIGEEVEATRSPGDIAKELTSLKQTLSAHSQRNSKSVAQLTAEFKAARHKYERLGSELDQLDKLRLVRSVGFRARTYKQMGLSCRGYFGQIILNHVQETLELKVQTDDQAYAGSDGYKKNPSVLSGGEQSLSTLCFLLSLWETCGHPIRCLDEFDVFMDQQNRRCSIRMLIDAAKSANSKQTIIITPQSIDNVFAEPPVIRIMQMADPRND